MPAGEPAARTRRTSWPSPAGSRSSSAKIAWADPINGARNLFAGLALKATDQDLSNGTGPAVQGPLLSLVMAMTGRKAHVDDLTGEGVERLGRCE